MKLLTHNLLQCIVTGCHKKANPLDVVATKMRIEKKPFDQDFTLRMIPRIDYELLVKTYERLLTAEMPPLPKTPPGDMGSNADFLKSLHFALSCVVIEEGELICAQCGRRYPIHSEIPNMIVRQIDEIAPPEPASLSQRKKTGTSTSSGPAESTEESETTSSEDDEET